MNDVKITVGGAIEQEATRRFVDAWHRAARGKKFRERYLAFESWGALARILRIARADVGPNHRVHEIGEWPLEIQGCCVVGAAKEHDPA